MSSLTAWLLAVLLHFADRRLAARIDLRVALSSLHRCRHLPPEDRLSALGGACRRGHRGAQGHYWRWLRIRAWEPRG